MESSGGETTERDGRETSQGPGVKRSEEERWSTTTVRARNVDLAGARTSTSGSSRKYAKEVEVD
jgi:hypothetical protein